MLNHRFTWVPHILIYFTNLSILRLQINDYKLFTSIILWYTHKLNLQPRLAYKN